MKQFIGISGKKQSGKSTVAELIQLYHPNVKIVNFADALKEEVAERLHVSVEEINTNKHLYRAALQLWGTDVRRLQNIDYWVNEWHRRVDSIIEQNPATIIVCADVRFTNEIQALQFKGASLFRIVRQATETLDRHQSENDIDYVVMNEINNNGTQEQLAAKVRELINK